MPSEKRHMMTNALSGHEMVMASSCSSRDQASQSASASPGIFQVCGIQGAPLRHPSPIFLLCSPIHIVCPVHSSHSPLLDDKLQPGQGFCQSSSFTRCGRQGPQTAARASHSSVPNLHICGVKGPHTHVVKPKSWSRVDDCHGTLQCCGTLAWQVLGWQDTHPVTLASRTGRP